MTRNITGCPLAGLDGDELLDASPLVQAATAMVNGSPEFYNLPRKYKVSITGCRVWCSYPEINDVGLTAVRDLYSGRVGFSLRVGGGLSTRPHLAPRLAAFVRPEQVLRGGEGRVARSSATATCSARTARRPGSSSSSSITDGRRSASRPPSRTGSASASTPRCPRILPDEVYRDHVGVHPQKQAGLVYAGLPILRGRLGPDEMRAVADLAERHGSGELRATTMQNLVVVNVPAHARGPARARRGRGRAAPRAARRSGAARWPAPAASSASSR